MKDPLRVTTLTRLWRRLRLWLTPSEWMVWLLGLSRSSAQPNSRGLILIQIDGLPQKQLEKALADGRMPFLKSLLEKENYATHSFYSGLPSSTPAVQAELYYGQPTVVPAFGFRDHRTGRLVRMFANDTAMEVESELSRNQQGLLAGGSSYCNIYGGGAADVHFCATSFGWSEFLNTVNPVKMLIFMLLKFGMFVRVFGLMCIELVLAIVDFFRGLLKGRQFWQELIMIPARVMVCVLLRELVVTGICFDSARGLPIIHGNFLGYDEQSHRRGPTSAFAHWSLKAIDYSIRRIWNAAHRGEGREYDLWVFSDHGQESTRPYQLQQGSLIQEVVATLVEDDLKTKPPGKKRVVDRLPTRANWLGIGWLVSMLFGEQDHDIQTRSAHVQTVTSGPVGFVYLLTEEARQRRDELATRLVQQKNVPMTVIADGRSGAKVTMSTGVFQLPQDAVQVFGATHPFLNEVTTDLIRMARHPDAGDLLLVGWTPDRSEATSFVLQNGAHAGPGIEETRGFALLPVDAPVPDSARSFLRPADLRHTVLRFLGRISEDAEDQTDWQTDERKTDGIKQNDQLELLPAKVPLAPKDAMTTGRIDVVSKNGLLNEPVDENFRVRLMTYNVHACVGMDGQLSPQRIARVIAQSEAGVVCMQELDVARARSQKIDQPHLIARHLEMNHQFGRAREVAEEKFGNAILSRHPMTVIETIDLYCHKDKRSRRSALWVAIDLPDRTKLQVINTHLSLYPRERKIQATQLLEHWLPRARNNGPVVLCGDFNSKPDSPTYNVFSKSLKDAESGGIRRWQATYFSPFPLLRVDHLFLTHDLVSENTCVVSSRLAKMASDHLPLVTDLVFKKPGEPADGLSSEAIHS